MTRLKEEWIKSLNSELDTYEKELINKTGLSLLELSSLANGVNIKSIIHATKHYTVSVIPITSGQGIINYFSESVAAIINRMGFKTMVTENSDVNGIYEAYKHNSTCIFIADDDRFIGINLLNNNFSENTKATARGYVTAFDALCKGVDNREILIIGYGHLGQEMHEFLNQKNVNIKIYDKNPKCVEGIKKEILLDSIEQIKEYPLIMDATNEGG